MSNKVSTTKFDNINLHASEVQPNKEQKKLKFNESSSSKYQIVFIGIRENIFEEKKYSKKLF